MPSTPSAPGEGEPCGDMAGAPAGAHSETAEPCKVVYRDKTGRKRTSSGRQRGGYRHGVRGGARAVSQQTRLAEMESRLGRKLVNYGTNSQDSALRASALNLHRCYSDLSKVVGKFESQCDDAYDRFNKALAVRVKDVHHREFNGMGLKRKRTSSNSLPTAADADDADGPPQEKKRRRRGHELLPGAQLRIAYPGPGARPAGEAPPLTAPMGASAVIARQHGVTPPVVTYTRNGMAELQTVTNERKLVADITRLKSTGKKLPYLVHKLKWDETGLPLNSASATSSARAVPGPDPSLLMIADAQPKRAPKLRRARAEKFGNSSAYKRRHRTSHARPSRQGRTKSGKFSDAPRRHRFTEQIMVQKREYLFGNPNLAEDDRVIPVVSTPVTLQSTSAPCLDKGITVREPVPLQDLEDISHVLLLVREMDGAKSNITLMNHLKSEQLKSANMHLVLYVILCFVHQIHLIMSLVLSSIDGPRMSFVNSAYCTAHVLRAPGYFCRVHSSIEHTLRAHAGGLVINFDDPPPEGARQFNIELLELAGFDPADPDFVALMDLFTDRWDTTEAATHNCQCDPPCTFETLLTMAVILVGRVLFGRLMPIPLPARWMLVIETGRWLKLMFVPHAIGQRTLLHALSPEFLKKVNEEESARALTDGQVEDPCLRMQTSTEQHQAQLGKRLGRTVSFIAAPSSHRDLDCVLCSSLPANYVTASMLSAERKRSRNKISPEVPAPMLDLMNKPFSSVHAARQTYAAMLLQPAAESLQSFNDAVSGLQALYHAVHAIAICRAHICEVNPPVATRRRLSILDPAHVS